MRRLADGRHEAPFALARSITRSPHVAIGPASPRRHCRHCADVRRRLRRDRDRPFAYIWLDDDNGLR